MNMSDVFTLLHKRYRKQAPPALMRQSEMGEYILIHNASVSGLF